MPNDYLSYFINFFLYRNKYVVIQKFYIGIEQNFYLNYLTDITDIKKILQQKEKEGTFFFKREKRVEIMSLKMI